MAWRTASRVLLMGHWTGDWTRWIAGLGAWTTERIGIRGPRESARPTIRRRPAADARRARRAAGDGRSHRRGSHVSRRRRVDPSWRWSPGPSGPGYQLRQPQNLETVDALEHPQLGIAG